MNKTNSTLILKFISWALVVVLAIVGLFTISKADGYEIPGDGFEYLMMQISFQNHGSFDVTNEDIEDAKVYFDNEIFDTIYKNRADTTLVEGNNGKLYAKHFGLYSVLSLPLSRVFHFVGMNPAKAFMVMNLGFWLLSLAVVLVFLKADEWRKTLLIAFLVFNPVYFYLSWVHTEVFIFAFVVMGLVFWYEKKYIPAMLFSSFAATGNLTVLVIAFVIGIDFIVDSYKANKNIASLISKTIPVALCAIPGFVPVIMSFIRFGTYSPVAKVASVGSSLYPTDSRVWAGLSYIFDPNQGMLVYSGIIVPSFIVLAFLSLRHHKATWNTILNLFAAFMMLVIVSQELHINCGMSFIMRYNVWMLPLYAFYVVNSIEKLSNCIAVVGTSSVWSLAIIVVMLNSNLTNCYLDYTPIGKFFVDNFPSIYNPPVGIFYSRTLGNEVYYCDEPVAYRDEDGNVLKLLVTPSALDKLSDDWLIFNEGDYFVTNICGSGFSYINYLDDGVRLVPNTDNINFSDMTIIDESYILSDYGIEGESLLIYGNEFHIRNYMIPGIYSGSIGVSNVFGGMQQVIITVNGVEVYNGPVSMDDENIEFDFEVGENYTCDMVITIPGALSPSSVDPSSNDDRMLSLYLTEFQYNANA